jgi:hypothetical protein
MSKIIKLIIMNYLQSYKALNSLASSSNKERIDKDVRPIEPLRKNYDYGEGLYYGKMDKYKSVKDFINKKRLERKRRKKAFEEILRGKI